MRVRTFGELAHDIFRFMADWMRDARLQSKGKASSPCPAKIASEKIVSEIEKYARTDSTIIQNIENHDRLSSTATKSRLENIIDEGIDIISPTEFTNYIKKSWLAVEILNFKSELILSGYTDCYSWLIMIFDKLSSRIVMHVGVISALQGKSAVSIYKGTLKQTTYNELEEKSLTTLRERHAYPKNYQDMMKLLQHNANGIEWLVNDRKRKISENSKRGKENQAKGNSESRERAKHDMDEALAKVRNRVIAEEKKHGAEHGSVQILPICEKVCKHFKPLSPKKNAFGEFENCEELRKSNGEPVKPETLAKHYRKKFGTKKAQKKMPHK